MGQFADLWPDCWKASIATNRDVLALRLPETVADSLFSWWSPSCIEDYASRDGRPLLVLGVCTWSAYDLALLDIVHDFLERYGTELLEVLVFHFDVTITPEGLNRYIPDLYPSREWYMNPAVGFWDGRGTMHKGTDSGARRIVADVLGITCEQLSNNLIARAATMRERSGGCAP